MTKKTILKLMCIPVGILLICKTGQKLFKSKNKKHLVEEEIKEQVRDKVYENDADLDAISNELGVLYKIDKSPKDIGKWLYSNYSDFELALGLMLYFNISGEDIDKNVFIFDICNPIFAKGRDC